ncbi:MAG: hypothetical protein IRZ09_09830 [Variibacter sp.]|nr:hypothetical protein [Variibacter sp.]
MRMLLKAQIPTDVGNAAIEDGTLPQIIRNTLESLRAEAAYFTTMDGKRTMIAVFDMDSVSDMPRIAEPLFMGLNASIDFTPCMNASDLNLGLEKIR